MTEHIVALEFCVVSTVQQSASVLYICMCCVLSCSVVSDSATSWTVDHQAPLSMGFPRQEYWSGLPFPSTGRIFPTQELNLGLLHCKQIHNQPSYEGIPYIYIYPLFFGFPSHLGHHRALSRVPGSSDKLLFKDFWKNNKKDMVLIHYNYHIIPESYCL